jgi:hypothetical protein
LTIGVNFIAPALDHPGIRGDQVMKLLAIPAIPAIPHKEEI